MTLRTITYDTATHKLVPREPTDEMLEGAFNSITAVDEHFHLGVEARLYSFMIAAAPEYQKPENQTAKNAERYEKVRKLNVQEFAEIFRMNIQEGIPFDEIIDGLYIFTAEDIAEAEKEGEKMWHALCGDSTQDIGKDE